MVSSGLRLAFWSGTTVEGRSVIATGTNTYLRWHMYYGSERRLQVLHITKLDDFNIRHGNVVAFTAQPSEVHEPKLLTIGIQPIWVPRILLRNHNFNLAIPLLTHFF